MLFPVKPILCYGYTRSIVKNIIYLKSNYGDNCNTVLKNLFIYKIHTWNSLNYIYYLFIIFVSIFAILGLIIIYVLVQSIYILFGYTLISLSLYISILILLIIINF